MSILYNNLKVSSQSSPLVLQKIEEVLTQFTDLASLLMPLEIKLKEEGSKNSLPNTVETLFRELQQKKLDLALVNAIELPYPLTENLKVVALLDGSIKSANLSGNDINDLGEHLFQGDPLDDYLALVAHADQSELVSLFTPYDSRQKFGKVTLVGFGPGNADLLTIGGDKALAKADVIFHDDLLDQSFPAKYRGEKFYVGKRKDCHSFRQDKINRLLFNAAKVGRCVVRLKGGDPMVFAHGGEELEFLHRNFVEVSVLPGVSAGIAVAAYTQIPLTHRGISSSVAFISGHSDSVRIPETDTVVCFMGGCNIRMIAQKAIDQGKRADTPVMLVHNISLPDQKEYFSTLQELTTNTVKYPTPIIIVSGKVVALRNNSEMEVLKPVFLVTGTTTEKYQKLGTVIHQPLIEVNRIQPYAELENFYKNLKQFDWIFFTSRYTVQFFFEFLKHYGKDSRSLAHLKIASMGELTSKALTKYGIVPDLQPEDESSQGLIKAIEAQGIPNGHALIPRSNLGLPILPENLARLGWTVTRPVFYENKYPDNLMPLDLTDVQTIVFPAPSCVTNFLRLYGELPNDKRFIFRGRETEKRFLELSESVITSVS